MNYIRSLDQFGSQFNPYIDDGTLKFKTFLGGLATLVIYSVSLLYAIFVFIQWRNNELPSISNISYNSVDYLKFQTDEIFLSVQMFDRNNNPLSVFDAHKRFFIPTIMQVPSYILFPNYKIVNNSILQIGNLDLTLSKDNLYYSINFLRCQNSSDISIQCASNEEIDVFFQNFIRLEMSISIQQFDLQKREISKKIIHKDIQYLLQPNQTLINTVNVKTANARVSNGFITKQISNNYYIYDCEVSSQDINIYYLENTFGMYSYATILLQLDNIQLINDITPPSLGSVLASIGSIVSLLMFSQNIILAFNNHQMQTYIQDLIVKYYYPEFNQLEIKKNIKGQIIRIKMKDKQYEHEEINKLYQQAMKIANKKLSILNIIYEISRIQFLLQQMQPKDNFERTKSMGIKLELIQLKKQSKKIQPQYQTVKEQEQNEEIKSVQEEPSQNHICKDFILEDQDIFLLMQPNLTYQAKKIQVQSIQKDQNPNQNNSSFSFDIM